MGDVQPCLVEASVNKSAKTLQRLIIELSNASDELISQKFYHYTETFQKLINFVGGHRDFQLCFVDQFYCMVLRLDADFFAVVEGRERAIKEVLKFFIIMNSNLVDGQTMLKSLDPFAVRRSLAGLEEFLQCLGPALIVKIASLRWTALTACVAVLVEMFEPDVEAQTAELLLRNFRLLLCEGSILVASTLPGVTKIILRFSMHSDHRRWSLVAKFITLLFEVVASTKLIEHKFTEKWHAQANARLCRVVNKLSSRFIVATAGWQCRKAIGLQAARLVAIGPTCMNMSRSRLFDVVATLLYDPDPMVCEAIKTACDGWSKKISLMANLVTGFYNCCLRMPKLSAEMVPSRQMVELQQFAGYIELLGVNWMRNFCLCDTHVCVLVSALTCVKPVVCNVQYYVMEGLREMPPNFFSLLSANSPVDLQVPINPDCVKLIQRAYESVGSMLQLPTLIDKLMLSAFGAERKLGALYALSRILQGYLKSGQETVGPDELEHLMQVTLSDFSDRLNAQAPVRIFLLLDMVRYCSLLMKENTKSYLFDSLSLSLRVANNADFEMTSELTLKALALAVGQPSVDHLLRAHLEHLISDLLIQMQYYNCFTGLADVMTTLFKRIDTQSAKKATPLVKELMRVLDQLDDKEESVKNVFMALGSFSQLFIVATGERPAEAEEREPWYVGLIVEMLDRTYVWMRSEEEQCRMASLHAFKQGALALQPFQSALLPCLHKNWNSLQLRFSDPCIHVMSAAFKAFFAVVTVSGDFYSTRFWERGWPVMHSFLSNLCAVSENASPFYVHREKCRLQCEMIAALPTIFFNLRPTVFLYAQCKGLLEKYSSDAQPAMLREQAMIATARLEGAY